MLCDCGSPHTYTWASLGCRRERPATHTSTFTSCVHGCAATAITALASTGPAVKAPILPAEPLRHTRAAALPGSGSRPRGARETSWALARGEVSPPSVVVRSGHPSLLQPGGAAHLTSRHGHFPDSTTRRLPNRGSTRPLLCCRADALSLPSAPSPPSPSTSPRAPANGLESPST